MATKCQICNDSKQVFNESQNEYLTCDFCMHLYYTELDKKIDSVLDLDSDGFEGWTPTQRIYNKIDVVLTQGDSDDSINLLLELRDIFDGGIKC